MRAVFAWVLLIAATAAAHAAPAVDDTREAHVGAMVGGSAIYLGVEFIAKPYLVPDACRICEPPAVDAAVSDALRWQHTEAANLFSTVIGYAGAPLYAMAMNLAFSPADRRRRLDDATPVLEAGISIGLLHHLVKFTVGRQRPFVHHAAPGTHVVDDDDNASLFSGHTGLAFAVATAGGVVAHERHYGSEPWIWTGGFVIAATTGYLRIAADKHWFTDVAIGAVVGVGMGLAIPLLLHRDTLTHATLTTGEVPVTSPATARDAPHMFAFSIPF